MIVTVSGHRPDKLPNISYVMEELRRVYEELGVTKVIQGMAAGVDLLAARVAYESAIPFVCARPWKTHGVSGLLWEKYYERALAYATEVVDVSTLDYYPGPFIYQRRNEWMVDHSEYVIAVWDGSPSGTANCIKYAASQGKRMLLLHPEKSNGSNQG